MICRPQYSIPMGIVVRRTSGMIRVQTTIFTVNWSIYNRTLCNEHVQGFPRHRCGKIGGRGMGKQRKFHITLLENKVNDKHTESLGYDQCTNEVNKHGLMQGIEKYRTVFATNSGCCWHTIGVFQDRPVQETGKIINNFNFLYEQISQN